MTTISHAIIGGSDYAIGTNPPILRAELTRTINAVGSWEVILRNIGGAYNNTFDVQDYFFLSVDGANVLMEGSVDGPAITLRGKDLESIWDEYVVVRGVDRAQDLNFHNDYDYKFPDTTQQLSDMLHQIFNFAPPFGIGGLTNIIYMPPGGGTPVIGAFEFREGASFLTQLQEAMRRAGYIFYVDDNIVLQSGSPGFSAAPAPSVFRSVAGNTSNNIIDVVDYQKRDGDKHYNYVKLIGKAPMFDGWTEYNAGSWNAALGAGITNDTATTRVGNYSIVVYNNPVPLGGLQASLNCPIFNYTSWDFSSGEIGVWCRYDNIDAAPGTPGVGAANAQEPVTCLLSDVFGADVNYYSSVETNLYEERWGYCTFPLGQNLHSGIGGLDGTWVLSGGTEFRWDKVASLSFQIGGIGNDPSHFYIDGISLPIPIISIQEDALLYPIYRRRPYVDTWAHVRTQHALDNCSWQIFDQSKNTLIDRLKFTTRGTPVLRYAAQTIDVDIPPLGINSEVFYITQLKHVIEPMTDVSGGYGFDWVTEVECLPISGVTYDQARLRSGPFYSVTQTSGRNGAGVR